MNQFNRMSTMVEQGQHEALAQMLDTLSMREGGQICSMLLIEAVRSHQVECVTVLMPMSHQPATEHALMVACILDAHNMIDVLATGCSARICEQAYHQLGLHYQTQRTLLKQMTWLDDNDRDKRMAILADLERGDIDSQLSDTHHSKNKRKM